MKRLLVLACLLMLVPGLCQAKELFGKDASRHIGSLKEKLAGGNYTVIMLERRDHESITQALFDGVVFIPGETKYHYIRRLNGNHVLKLNTVQGTEASPVKPEDAARYESLFADNRLYPHVLLDKDGKEALIIYSALRERIVWKREANGEIYLEVRDTFKRDNIEFPDFKSINSLDKAG
jgi:hypothetical protein